MKTFKNIILILAIFMLMSAYSPHGKQLPEEERLKKYRMEQGYIFGQYDALFANKSNILITKRNDSVFAYLKEPFWEEGFYTKEVWVGN